MTQSKPERRSKPRLPKRLPVKVKSQHGTAQGFTRDLSTSGIFLYTDAEIVPGAALELVLVLPPELTNGERRWVCCQASVARVENGSTDGRFGAAATIHRLDVLPEIAE